MTRFLIIDDEEIIRRGIKNKILRLIEDAEIVGEAKDGEEALILTNQLHPDIVITDIKMPKVDGLLYIENSLKLSSDTQFIIVSGYQDFSFVQKALKLGVCDYLLKPIEDDDLRTAVSKLIERLNIKKKQQLHMNELKNKISYSDMLYKNRLFSKLVNGSLIEIDLLGQYSGFLSAKQYMVCSIRIHNSSALTNDLESKMVRLATNMFEETITEQIPCIAFEEENTEKSFIAVMFGTDLEQKMVPTIKETIEIINNLLSIELYIGLGRVYEYLGCIKESYTESQNSIKQKIIFETKKIISFEDYSKVKENNYILLENIKKTLESFLKVGDYKNVVHLIDSIFLDVSANRIMFSKVENLSLELLFIIINTLKISKNYENTDLNSKRIDYFFRDCITYKDFHEIVLSRAKQVCDYMDQSTSETETGKGIIKEILNRIEVEYYRNLKLIDLADEYFLNPSYLSQLFLQQTHKNFKQYLSEMRIKNAKSLLTNTKIPISKISELVGYGDRSHFSKTFIIYTGITPAQYRIDNS
jgi:two-component system, response regulator YesN